METEAMETKARDSIGFGRAVAHQFKLLWSSRRPLLLAVGLLALLILAGDPWTQDSKMRLLTMWPLWLVLVGPAWAFAVFWREGPEDRLYFWSQPTGRAIHVLARLAAGLAWLWIMMAGLILAGWLVGVLDGDAWQMAEIGVAGWVNLFTGPLLGYLMVSVLTTVSNHPVWWAIGIMFAFPLLISVFTEWLDWDERVEQVLQPLINEDWGLGVTLIGGLGRAVNQLDHTLRVLRDPTYSGSSTFDAAQYWWSATGLWVVFFVAVVAFAATRHPDTLPKWRGFRR